MVIIQNMKTIPILFAFDKRFELPAGVCLTSLLENADPDTFYDIFILHGSDSDFSASKLNRIKEVYNNCQITFKDVSGAFSGAYQVRGITEATYYRLIAPEMIPQYDKILYSDVDVIFREDLSSYYNLDMGENYYAAVDNCSALRPDVQDYISSLGLDFNDGYFYAGNLVINSRKIREDNLVAKFKELGLKQYQQQDMDIFNIACNKRILALGPSFCLTVQLYDLIVNRRSEMLQLFSEKEIEHALVAGIVHYNGTKPWNSICLNMDIWWSYYRKSIYFDEKECRDFWDKQGRILLDLSFKKRVKLLVRYLLGKDK